jgi:hypothetical protein
MITVEVEYQCDRCKHIETEDGCDFYRLEKEKVTTNKKETASKNPFPAFGDGMSVWPTKANPAWHLCKKCSEDLENFMRGE